MAGKLRFYLDENVPVEVARQLRAREIDVVTVRDLGLLGDEDVQHLQRASEMGRVLCAPTTPITSCWRLKAKRTAASP